MESFEESVISTVKSRQFIEKLKKALNYTEYNYFDMQVAHYDEKIIKDNQLEGQHFKEFYRIKGNCFDKLKKELFDNENCSYVTYFNKVAKEGLPLENISVLAKRIYSNDVIREVLSSQILNAVEVPTCANIGFYESYKDAPTRIVGSVDFISDGEKFLNGSDFKGEYTHFSKLEDTVQGIRKIFVTHEITKNNPALLQKLLDDFVYSYLMRRLVLGDHDCHPWNCGFLVNKKEKYIKLVNFDYENSFLQNRIGECEDGIKFAKEKFPSVYKKYMFYVKNMLKAVKQAIPSIEDVYHKNLIKNLRDNILSVIATDELLEVSVK